MRGSPMKPSRWVVLLLCACGPADPRPVVRQYALNLRANYQDVVSGAEALQAAVDALVAAPSQETHEAAKRAWLQLRPVYGESEVARFYGGPIDASEGRINAWPIDEAFIDYTRDNPTAGIINRPQDVP